MPQDNSARYAFAHILVASNFTAISQKTVAFARAVALRFGSSMELLHVFNPSVVTSYDDALLSVYPVDRKRSAKQYLEGLAECLCSDGIDVTARLVEGHNPARTIQRVANERETALIIVGNECPSRIERLIVGSTAEDLMHRCKCPVLAVGPRTSIPADGSLAIKTIVFATDFAAEWLPAAEFALSFAQGCGAHVFCCSGNEVYEGEPAILDALATTARNRLKQSSTDRVFEACSPEFVVAPGTTADVILALAKRVKADVVIVGALKPPSWLSWSASDTMIELLAKLTCPLVSFPAQPANASKSRVESAQSADLVASCLESQYSTAL